VIPEQLNISLNIPPIFLSFTHTENSFCLIIVQLCDIMIPKLKAFANLTPTTLSKLFGVLKCFHPFFGGIFSYVNNSSSAVNNKNNVFL